uniref:tRNA(adenine(34)) deaminase n=1 Tax=Kalanchoe fedtschenkoi TaxID=63787 RepID=A0A7N0UNY9_KALFE
MYSGFLSPSVGFRANGSNPIRVSESCYCFDRGLQICGHSSSYGVSCCCCCCAFCVRGANSNGGLAYGLRQSSLLQWSGGRRLMLGGAGNGCYERLRGFDFGSECCDGDRSGMRKVSSFGRFDYGGGFRERRTWRGTGRIGGLEFVERREWRRYAGGLSEAEDLIDLLTDNVGECTVVHIETEIVPAKRKKEKKLKEKERVCDECNKRKAKSVASGSNRGNSRRDELNKIDLTSTGHGRGRNEDVSSEKKSELRKSGGAGFLQRKSRHEESTRTDSANVAHGRRRSEDVNALSERNARLRKDGSGCTSYHSLSSSGGIGSDVEIENVEEFENNNYVEEQASRYKEFRNQNDEEKYQEIERHGKKRHEVRLEEAAATGSHEGNVVVWDRKKSEKKLVETALDLSQSAAETAKKRFTASEADNSSLYKSDTSRKQFQTSEEDLSVISNRREERIHSDMTGSTQISRSRRRRHNVAEFEDIRESDAVTDSNQVVQSRVRQGNASTQTSFTQAVEEHLQKDEVGRTSQQHTGTLSIEEIDDTSVVSNSRHGNQSTSSVRTSVQETKEDHRQHDMSTVTKSELRRKSQQITEISEINRTEIQKTSISKLQYDSGMNVGNSTSSSIVSLSEGAAAGMIRPPVREDLQQSQSRKGSKASLESVVQSSGLAAMSDSQRISHQGAHRSDERVTEEKEKSHGRSQLDERDTQMEVRWERQRLAQESSLHGEASEVRREQRQRLVQESSLHKEASEARREQRQRLAHESSLHEEASEVRREQRQRLVQESSLHEEASEVRREQRQRLAQELSLHEEASEERREQRQRLVQESSLHEEASEVRRVAQESSLHEEASEEAFNLSLETRKEQGSTKTEDRTTQSTGVLSAHQSGTRASLSKVQSASYVSEKASQDLKYRYNSQQLGQQGQYHISEFESYGGEARDDAYAQPLSRIFTEDALGSAERIESSSGILIEEFVEQAKSKSAASEIKGKLKKTKSDGEDSKKQMMVKLGSGGAELKGSLHSSEGSEAVGPSDEKWDSTQTSVELPPRTKTPEVSPKAGNVSVRRTGRSMWNVIGDVFRARWIFRGESHSSPSKSRKRSSSNESVSSEAWFSGHEHDENITKDSGKRIPFQESASPSNLAEPGKEPKEIQQAGSGAIVIIDEPAGSGSSLSPGTSGSSSAAQEASLTYEEAKQSSSGPEASILATFSSAGMLGTSISFPSRKLSRSPVIGGTSLSARNDPSGSMGMVDPQPPPLSPNVASEAEEKRELTRRKFQRTTQVPKDRFEEWEEAYKRETEQQKIDEIFMREALVEAQKAADNWEVPVGAVLVQHGKIIARGCNLVEELRDSTAHAEMICIREASNALRTWRLAEATLYVTLEPCAMCAGAILQARVTSLVWGAPNKLLGADGSWIRLFPDSGERDSSSELADKPPAPVHPFHPKMNIRRGVLSAECAQVMQQFFQLRRQKKNKSEPSSPPSPPSCLPVSTNPVKLITKVHGLFSPTFCL